MNELERNCTRSNGDFELCMKYGEQADKLDKKDSEQDHEYQYHKNWRQANYLSVNANGDAIISAVEYARHALRDVSDCDILKMAVDSDYLKSRTDTLIDAAHYAPSWYPEIREEMKELGITEIHEATPDDIGKAVQQRAAGIKASGQDKQCLLIS